MTDERPRPPSRKAPRKVTPDYLERAALHYLERFASSAEGLRRVLLRKVEQSCRAHGTDREEAAGWVEALIDRYRRAGLLDDAAFAQARAATLQRRGGSTRAIRHKLAAKGVAADHIDAALASLDESGPDGTPSDDADLTAAIAYARRRRLGPFRTASDPNPDPRRRDKDLAALARAGFGLDTARKVVDAPDVDSLEEMGQHG